MILPGPPYRISEAFARGVRRRALLLGLLGALFLGGSGFWVGYEGRGILRDRALWASGEPAVSGGLEGKERQSHFVFYDYDLDVSYVDASAHEHRGKASFMTLLRGADTGKEPEIRYDRADPRRFVVSWAIEAMPWRWAVIAAILAMLGWIGPGLFWAAYAQMRGLRDASRCAEAGSETEFEVVERKEVIVHGHTNVHYKLRWPPGLPGAAIFKHEASSDQAELLRLDAGATRVLALRAPGAERPVLILENLWPYEFGEAARRGIADRLKARRG